ncbi:MAG: DUF11 domain-containing protein [Planctomycetaceae bacterium]|nr:DUF11 domain-containing protein [Planctomycetaceae bacterium]
MSYKTFSLFLIGFVLMIGFAVGVTAEQPKPLRVTRVSAEYAVTVLGQEASKPGFLDRMKSGWRNLIGENEQPVSTNGAAINSQNNGNSVAPTNPSQNVVPVRPPRPATVEEQQRNGIGDDDKPATVTNDVGRVIKPTHQHTTTGNSSNSANGNRQTPSRTTQRETSGTTDNVAAENKDSVYIRMQQIRESGSRFSTPARGSDYDEQIPQRSTARSNDRNVYGDDLTTSHFRLRPATDNDSYDSRSRGSSRPIFDDIVSEPIANHVIRESEPFPRVNTGNNDDGNNGGMLASIPNNSQLPQRNSQPSQPAIQGGVRPNAIEIFNADSQFTNTNRRTTNSSNASAVTSSTTTIATNQTPRASTLTVTEREPEKSVIVSPLLEVETTRPQRVIVGQESSYNIRLINRSSASAEQVVLQVELPEWIEIQPPEVSVGTTNVSQLSSENSAKMFTWRIDKINANAEEQLVLHLIPTERKSFNLKLHYDFKRPTTIAPIEVQEPTIEMAIDGPTELMWGTQQLYQLKVRNTGNGDAEKVKLVLVSGTAENSSGGMEYVIERLAAGAEEVVKINADALQENFLDISVVATGPYDLQAKASRRINILRPKLVASLEAPDMLFVGNRAEYTLRVRNVGNAPAEKVEVRADIPLSAKYLSNNAGGRATPQNAVIWNTDTIAIGGEFVAKFICEMKRQGTTKVEVFAEEKTRLKIACSGETQVDSVADLKMKIENPQGPVEVGSDAVYTITISNNGTKDANDVDVNVMFGWEIKPVSFEGLQGEILDDSRGSGIIAFQRIPTISAGQTLPPIKVKAVADKQGNHKIRVELACQSTGSQLVHEESAYYYVKRGVKATSPETPVIEEPVPVTTIEIPAEPIVNSPFAAAESIQAPATPKPVFE